MSTASTSAMSILRTSAFQAGMQLRDGGGPADGCVKLLPRQRAPVISPTSECRRCKGRQNVAVLRRGASMPPDFRKLLDQDADSLDRRKATHILMNLTRTVLAHDHSEFAHKVK